MRYAADFRYRLKPDRRYLPRLQLVDDLPTEDFSISQLLDWPCERLRSQSTEPQWHVSSRGHVRKSSPFNRARDRARGIEPAPRYGEREEERRKTQGEVCEPRILRSQTSHRPLERRVVSLELAFQCISACGAPDRSPQEKRLHAEHGGKTRRQIELL
jgi:hypothetical protein